MRPELKLKFPAKAEAAVAKGSLKMLLLRLLDVDDEDLRWLALPNVRGEDDETMESCWKAPDTATADKKPMAINWVEKEPILECGRIL